MFAQVSGRRDFSDTLSANNASVNLGGTDGNHICLIII